jgi:hypothetical protein
LLRAAAEQDHRVPALERETGSVDRDVRPGLVDHPDDAHRDPDLPQSHPVGQRRAAHDLTHRVGQGGELAQGVGDRDDPLAGQCEPVEESRGGAVLTPPRQVLGVGCHDLGGRGDERVSQRVQRGVLGRARRGREHTGRDLGTARGREDLRRDIVTGRRLGRHVETVLER